MKKLFYSLLFIFICAGLQAQEADLRKMSSMIAQKLHTAYKANALHKTDKKRSEAIFALVKLQKGDNDDALLSRGCKIVDRIGDICFTMLPVNSIAELSADSRVIRMEANPPMSVLLDSVQKSHNLIPAYEGKDLPQAYTGSGVVVGVADVGFDFTNPMFLDKEGKSRIKSAWDIYTGKGEGFQEIGSLYTTHEELMRARGTCDTTQYHGTHVMGIAAGSAVKGGKYRGIAYEADIVTSLAMLSGYTEDNLKSLIEDINRTLEDGNADPYWSLYFEDDLSLSGTMDILAIKHIFTYAAEHNQPCVVNCSWGSQMRLVSDYTLANEIFTELTGPGRIIVCAAGNSSDTDIYRVKLNGEILETPLWFKSSMTPAITLRSSKAFSITMHPDIDGFGAIALSSADIPLATEDSVFEQYIYKGDETNRFGVMNAAKYIMEEGDTAYAMTLQLPDTKLNTYNSPSLNLKIEGEGAVEIMGQYDCAGFTRFSLNPKNCPYTVSTPAAYDDAIAVGFTSNRNELPNIYKDTIKASYNLNEEGKIVSWSGTGPTLSGNIKPDISAAGYNIVSAYSSLLRKGYYFAEEDVYKPYIIDSLSYDGKPYYMYVMSGTSMSAPVVTGIIALWLQADPTLTPKQIKELFAKTATHPEEDETYPNNRYGYGVIDAYKGLCEILNLNTNIPNFSDRQPQRLKISVDNKKLMLNTDTEVTVSIYSLNGHLQRRTTTDNGVVDLSDLQPAVYAVQINSDDPSATGSTLIRLQ